VTESKVSSAALTIARGALRTLLTANMLIVRRVQPVSRSGSTHWALAEAVTAIKAAVAIVAVVNFIEISFLSLNEDIYVYRAK